jgi:hypothetical protein
MVEDRPTAAEATIARLKEALNAGSDGQLAKFLGLSRQNIGAARKRNDVPPGWIFKVAELTGDSMDWLGFGRGPRNISKTYAEPGGDAAARIASPRSTYHRPATPGSEKSVADRGGESFGEAVEMLSRIYHSGDETLIRATAASIRVFCDILDRE